MYTVQFIIQCLSFTLDCGYIRLISGHIYKKQVKLQRIYDSHNIIVEVQGKIFEKVKWVVS